MKMAPLVNATEEPILTLSATRSGAQGSSRRAHGICAAAAFLAAMVIGVIGEAAQAETTLEVTHFPGGGTWPIYAGLENGYFAKAGITIHFDPITSSVAQITGMMAGKYDLGMTAFDNVLAYDAGQTTTQLAAPADLIAFLGGEGGSLHLITAPEVKKVEDLKGKTLAVDAKTTGYA